MAAAQFTQVMPLTGMTAFFVSIGSIYYHKVGLVQREKREKLFEIKRFLVVTQKISEIYDGQVNRRSN
jgi:hypothetical protein